MISEWWTNGRCFMVVTFWGELMVDGWLTVTGWLIHDQWNSVMVVEWSIDDYLLIVVNSSLLMMDVVNHWQSSNDALHQECGSAMHPGDELPTVRGHQADTTPSDKVPGVVRKHSQKKHQEQPASPCQHPNNSGATRKLLRKTEGKHSYCLGVEVPM